MKIADQLHHLFKKNPTPKDVYLSLTLFHQHVSGCVWSIGEEESLEILHCTHAESTDTSWEKRIEAADSVVSTLEEQSGAGELHKTVLGFAPEFLTPEGDITKSIRPDIKRLTTMLDLKPVGFVNIETAIMFQIKHEEGVPPSVILLHVAGDELRVSLYRVGTLVGERNVHISEFVVEDVETAIKSFPDIEVLPSRMILYGTGKEELDVVKSQLLTHQWTTRANFLHYPTIDVFELAHVAHAVALAGASELTATFVEDKTEPENIGEEQLATTVVAQQGTDEKDEKTMEDVIKEDQEEQSEEKGERKEKEQEEEEEEEEIIDVHPEDANVVPVAPESLGFQETDVLEYPVSKVDSQGKKEEEDIQSEEKKSSFGVTLKEKMAAIIGAVKLIHIPTTSTKLPIIPLLLAVFVLLGVAGLIYYFVPKATVTIGVVPNIVTKSKTITIATGATSADQAKFIIPAKKLEQSVTGEKTATVTGKKRIGDPAKGTVILYNKTTTSRTIKKGAVLSSNALQFTLDGDVDIASASESIGSITYGKATAAVTAVAIGEEGNLPAGSDFTFKDMSSSIAIARNDQPFTGGTSKETTVVSRADYDAMVKALSDELVTKAKADLLAGVAGGEKLIDQTIKTTVTSKTFREELDQEATELHGKITLTISGISYNESDAKSVLLPLASSDIPNGYAMNEGRTTVTMETPVIKKDGSITAAASISLVSLPTVTVDAIKKELKGKTITQAQEIIKKIQGVGSVEIFFLRSPSKKRLPFNTANITVDVVVNQ